MTLTEVEKCWLVALYDDGYRYLARDNPEYLGAYTRKPHRTSLGAWDEFCGRLWYIPAKNFRFIDEKTLFKICKNSEGELELIAVKGDTI